MKDQMKKCIVHGCTNHEGEGVMQGVLCMPCYIMLTGGAVTSPGMTFIHDMLRLNKAQAEDLQKIRKIIDSSPLFREGLA